MSSLFIKSTSKSVLFQWCFSPGKSGFKPHVTESAGAPQHAGIAARASSYFCILTNKRTVVFLLSSIISADHISTFNISSWNVFAMCRSWIWQPVRSVRPEIRFGWKEKKADAANLREAEACCDRPIINLSDVMFTVCISVIELVLMISSYITMSMLVNCCHCFPAYTQYSSVLISRPLCTSGSVSLYNHMVLTVFSIVYLLSFFFLFISTALSILVSSPPSPPLILICVSSARLTLPLPQTVQHSSPIWPEWLRRVIQ